MNTTTESGVLAYMAFRLAHAMFQRAPAELDAGEQRRLAGAVRRQAAIEAQVLAADESRDVVVPEATVRKALAQLRERYADDNEFAAALEAQGFNEEVLADALARQLRVEAVLDKVSMRSAAISELDVQLHYHLSGEQYRQPERRIASHILITINDQFPENTRERAAQRIAEIRRRLVKDPARFEEQALKHSECPTAMNGGRLGEYRRGQLFPQLDAALFALPRGGLSEVLESELGFHLLRCEEILPASVPPYAELAPKIRASIEAKRRRLCQREWLAGIMQPVAGRAGC